MKGGVPEYQGERRKRERRIKKEDGRKVERSKVKNVRRKEDGDTNQRGTVWKSYSQSS